MKQFEQWLREGIASHEAYLGRLPAGQWHTVSAKCIRQREAQLANAMTLVLEWQRGQSSAVELVKVVDAPRMMPVGHE